MAGRRSGWRTVGAIFAAYLLVVQATLTGMTLGAQAAPQSGALVDVFCSPSGSPADTSQTPPKRHGLPHCCVVGCAMLGGGTAPAPDFALLAPTFGVMAVEPIAAAHDPDPRTRERSPRTTRAPPLPA